MKESTTLWALVFTLVLLWAYSSFLPEGNEVGGREHYCEMVDLFISSGGENGWPDYKRSYAKECAEVEPTSQKETQ